MKFDEITGNDALKRTLVSMIDSGRVPHAMLLYENDGCGAVALALAFLQYLNCHHRAGGEPCGECPSCRQMSKLIHPDVHFVFPVNKSAKVSEDKPTSDSFLTWWRALVLSNPYFCEEDLQEALGIEGKKGEIALGEAKSIISKMSLTAVEDGYKAVLCYLPEKMNPTAANKLLKLVEEPPEKTVFVFVTHAPEKMMQTVFSRCQSMRVLPLTKEEAARVRGEERRNEEFFSLVSSLLDAVARRDLLSALEAGEAAAALPSRERQKAFCAYLSACIRRIFLLGQNQKALAGVLPEETAFYEVASSRFGTAFCMKVETALDRTVSLIDRNVNSKILFCDLVDRIFVAI